MSKSHAALYAGIFALVVNFSLIACGGGKKQQQEKQQASKPPKAEVQKKVETTAFQPDLEKGKQLYLQTCSACHGPDAKGLPNLGKDLTASQFVKSKTDQELLEFVKVGRPAGDPLNTTGVAMPPKGGNPALTDEDILNIIAYIRTLQQ